MEGETAPAGASGGDGGVPDVLQVGVTVDVGGCRPAEERMGRWGT